MFTLNNRLIQFLEWMKATFTPSYQNEVIDYLSQAVDNYDLETRMKVLRYRGMM